MKITHINTADDKAMAPLCLDMTLNITVESVENAALIGKIKSSSITAMGRKILSGDSQSNNFTLLGVIRSFLPNTIIKATI